MSSRHLMAIVAGAVTMFVLGFLLYGQALAGFFEANQGTATGVLRDPPTWWALVVGQVVWAGLLVYVFTRGPSVTSFGDGARVGGLLGLLAALSVDLVTYGVTNTMNLTATLVDPVVFLVISAVTGGVVAQMLGRGGPAAA